MNWSKVLFWILVAIALSLIYFLYPNTITNAEYVLYASIVEGYLGFFRLLSQYYSF
jgi:hypothetical protein